MAGRRRVDDDELVLALRDGVGEGAKDRDLFGARGAQSLLRAARGPARRALARRSRGLPPYSGASRRPGRCGSRGRVAGRSRAAASTCAAGSVVVSSTWCPRLRELGRDAHGDRGLADAALAHRHHHALAARRDLLDQGIEALAAIRGLRDGVHAYIGCRPRPLPSAAATATPTRPNGSSGTSRRGSRRSPAGKLVERGAAASVECHGDGVVPVLRVEDAVDDQPDVFEYQVSCSSLRVRSASASDGRSGRGSPGQGSSVVAIAQRGVRGGVERLSAP